MNYEKINEVRRLADKLELEDLRTAANELCKMYRDKNRRQLASSGQSLSSFMVGDRVVTNDKGRRIPAGRIGTVSKRGRSRLHVRFDYDPSTVWTVPPSLLLHHTSADMAKSIVGSVTNTLTLVSRPTNALNKLI